MPLDELTPEEARVVGSLAEKQLTTPKYYPLTLNALVSACNQSVNREPVTSYPPEAVEQAIAGLRAKGVARVLHAGGGNRTTKFRHVLDEILGLDRRELSLITLLLLRGPQTLAELRTRSERMADFEDAAAVEHDLSRLAAREEPLVVRLERQPGQKEPRYATTLTGLPRPVPPGAPGGPRAAATPAPGGRSHFRPAAPRLAPLAGHELTGVQRELLESEEVRAAAHGGANIFTTLVRYPPLLRGWAALGSALLSGELSPRHRELAILRTAWLTGCDYEWGQHVPVAGEAGVSDAEIQRITRGPDASGWSALEAAVLRATDELHERASLDDSTWAALAAELEDRQLMELVFVIGHHHLLAFALNAFGVAPAEGVPALPEGADG